MICYFYRQPGHFRRDCPRRQETQGYGKPQSQSSVGRVRVSSQAGQMVCFHCQQLEHMRRDCPQRQGSQDFGTAQSQLAVGYERIQFIPPHPSRGQRNRFQSQGAIQAPLAAQMGQRGQSVGQGQAQSSQAKTSVTQGRDYAIVPEAEHADQSDMQGTFYTCICFLMHHVHHCYILRDRFGLRG